MRSLGTRRELVRHVKLARRSVAERLGSRRWSRPALNGLDRVLERHLPSGSGYFVEAGANDGYSQSNTYYLERYRDWTGVLVEPVPHLARICRRVRPRSQVVSCALVGPERAGQDVELTYADLMSVAEGARGDREADRAWAQEGADLLGTRPQGLRLPGRTLTEVLDESGLPRLDLLSLDVEGLEAEVLGGLDLERWSPGWILVEANDAESVLAVLGDRYEVAEQPTPGDLLLRRCPSRPIL